MYGHWLRLPVVDIDNTQWLMILGANPLASNGSLLTAPDMPGRLKALRARGGKLIVVDPRKTETAYKADQYLAMPPGKDIYLLLAMLNYLFASDQCHPGHLQPLLRGLDTLKAALSGFTPALAQEQTGIDAATICAITDELVREPKAAVYGRMGVSTQIHGSLCHWAIQLLNLLTGHLDVEGGTLLANPAVDAAGPGTNPQSYGRFHSRVRGLPEFGGEFPAATLADEMQQEGEGQVKALLTIAGNPVLSTPNGRRLDQALSELDFMVAVDFYINETTRHADIILPPVSPLERDNYDITFNMLSVHNTAKYSPAVFAKDGDALHDWQIFVKLAEAINELKQKPAKKTAAPAQMLDQMLQAGPYQLSLQQLIDNPHGIDLGPLRPRMLEVISPQQGIQLAPELLIDALADVPMSCQPAEAEFMLIGRRHIRSNNSWMHNFHRLVKGKDRHQLQMHSDDIKRRGFTNGGKVEVRSRIGKVEVELLACDDVSPGVVSLPHGFGHNRKNMRLDIATQHAGTSANDLTDQLRIDSVSGNAAINGVPVWIDAVG